MRSVIFAVFALFIAGCTGTDGQPQAKDCGYAYQECLSPAEASCTPAFGKLDDGDAIMSERIFGFEGDKCKIEMTFELPAELKGLSASCSFPKDTLVRETEAEDISDLCTYCTGTMIDAFKKVGSC